MKRIGLTGNIGSGKTLVSDIFKTLNVPVFNADTEAKKILDSPNVTAQLTLIFGEKILTNNQIDRTSLASIVFGNHQKLKQLNSIIHPAVRNHFTKWCSGFFAAEYVIYEAAIIFESGYYQQLDGTILVSAPEELRIERVIKRDNISRDQVLSRIKNQWPDEQKLALTQFEIKNDGTEMLIPQVMKIHSQLIHS